MIISRGRSYIFVHIPKTGGTSLALALEDRAMKDDILIGDTPKARRRRHKVQGTPGPGRVWKHSTLADVRDLVSVEEMGRMFTFTLVRNPWDRVVSYYHWLRGQTFDHPAVRLAQSATFDGFLSAAETQASLAATPAAHYMTDAHGQERCDCYIRLEQFETDAAPLREHLGFDLSLPWVNRSEREEDYRNYYTPKLEGIVATCCAHDIARFEYRFEP